MGYIGSLTVKGVVSSSFIWDREQKSGFFGLDRSRLFFQEIGPSCSICGYVLDAKIALAASFWGYELFYFSFCKDSTLDIYNL